MDTSCLRQRFSVIETRHRSSSPWQRRHIALMWPFLALRLFPDAGKTLCYVLGKRILSPTISFISSRENTIVHDIFLKENSNCLPRILFYRQFTRVKQISPFTSRNDRYLPLRIHVSIKWQVGHGKRWKLKWVASPVVNEALSSDPCSPRVYPPPLNARRPRWYYPNLSSRGSSDNSENEPG